ncbi:hypothetical protein N2152v2_003734 [Parachlorella kessleri]
MGPVFLRHGSWLLVLPLVLAATSWGRHLEAAAPATEAQSGNFSDYEGLAAAAVRGTTSANFTKKSFAVDLKMPDGSARTFPLLGMPEDDEWILYGGDELDLTQGMRTVYCEVFLVDDGRPLSPSHYYGIFIGEEKPKRAKERVDIQKLDANVSLSGGYLWIFDNDNIQAGDVLFGPAQGWENPFQLKYPGKKDATPGMLAWITDSINQFQAALEAPNWLTASPDYTSLIDGPNWVDYFLLVELTKNPDGYRGSTYMHKDRDGPLRMGPAWDYNEAFGECCGYPLHGWQRNGQSGPGVSGGSAISPEGFRFNICADPGRCLVEPGDGTSRWYRRMWQDPRYRQATALRWRELRAGPWSDAAITALIQSCATQIKPAVIRNYAKYEKVLLKAWYPDSLTQWTTEVANLQSWLLAHVAWLDTAFEKTAASDTAVGNATAQAVRAASSLP